MKRLIVAVILALAVFGVCMTGSIIVNNRIEKISAVVEDAIIAASNGDQQKALELSEKAAALWKNAEKTLETLSSHDSMEDISLSMERMNVFIAQNRTDWFILECRLTLLELEHISYTESFSLGNIL